MREAIFLPEASEDLEAAAIYYEQHQPGLGQQFVAEVKKARDRVVALPKAAPEVRKGIRRRSIHRFPYSVIYRAADEPIVIVAIAHKRRHPGFWNERI